MTVAKDTPPPYSSTQKGSTQGSPVNPARPTPKKPVDDPARMAERFVWQPSDITVLKSADVTPKPGSVQAAEVERALAKAREFEKNRKKSSK